MNFKKVGVWIIAAVALVVLIVYRFVVKGADSTALKAGGATGSGRNAPLVDTIVAGPGTITQTLTAVASLDTPYKVQISPTVSGLIKTVSVREGDSVKKGQTLATIDPADAASQLAQAVANAAEAQNRYTQAKLTQNPNDVGALSQIAQQDASVTSAKAAASQTRNASAAAISSAHSGVVDAESKLRSAQAMVNNQQAGVAKEQATYNDLKIKLDRTTELYNQRFVAAQDVDDAKAAAIAQSNTVKVAQALLNQANQGVISARAQLAQATDAEKTAQGKAKSDIVAADALVAQAQAQLRTASSNKAQIGAYQQNLAALLATVRAAQSQVTQARVRLDNTNLRSTIDGTVTNRAADPGTLANPGTPVLTVQFLDWLYATGSIAIEDSSDLHTGMPALVSLDDVPGKPVEGTLIAINQAADPTSRQFMIRIQIDNPGHKLRPGMFGHVNIVTQSVNAAVTLPKESIITDLTTKATTVAIVQADSTVKISPVTLGATDGVKYEIKSGVNAGDKVVSLAYSALKDGQAVKLPGAKGSGDTGSGGKGKGKGGSEAKPSQQAGPGQSQSAGG